MLGERVSCCCAVPVVAIGIVIGKLVLDVFFLLICEKLKIPVVFNICEPFML